MSIQHFWRLLLLAAVLSGIRANWEVLNDDGESRTEGGVDGFTLKQEHLLPVDAVPKRVNKAKQRSLSSLDQNETENNHQINLKVQAARKQNPASISNDDSKKIEDMKSRTLNSNKVAGRPENPRSDDDIDFVGEGLLSAENVDTHNLHNGRKPSQFQFAQESSQNAEVRNVQKQNSDFQILSQQQQSQNVPAFSKEDLALSFKVACVYENSWECLMFKEDLMAMQGDTNISRKSSVHERAKRQASSNYRNSETVDNSFNTRNLLGCEDGNCFSGGDNDTDEEEKSVLFNTKGQTKTRPKNFNATDLTDDKKKELAQEFEEQMSKIFDNIPCFKNVTINPQNIYFDSNGSLVYDRWVVYIDSGCSNYTGKNGTQVGDIVRDALKNAAQEYQNMVLQGVQPTNDLNVTKVIDDVTQQANDPNIIKPSPCSFGYGRAHILEADYEKMNGIRIRCYDNCVNFSSECATHGTCDKDNAGYAFCNCSHNWIGLYCEKENTTGANTDEIIAPPYTINLIAVFPTNLTSKDLTPEMRKEIAKNFTKQLEDILRYLPGFKNVTVDPNSITIENGKLIIPWQIILSRTGYTGETPDQIGDDIKNRLQNVSSTYKNSVLIDGQKPLEDLDFVDAGDQVEEQARDPCSTNPCSNGYGHCQALSPLEVKCIHNCNARATKCENGGTCELNKEGKDFCMCTAGWKGENCEENNYQESSDIPDGGEIAGIVIGSGLIAAGLAGLLCWFLLCARRNKNINFTSYTDPEGSVRNSAGGNSVFVIDRPQCSPHRLPLFTQSGPNSRNFSRPSSYETPSTSPESAAEIRSENPSEIESEIPSETRSEDPFQYSQA